MLGQLEIDLGALAENYSILQNKVGASCEVAAVVKANAYGCGVAAIAPVLEAAGAKTFFVATLPEALELRTIIDRTPLVATLNGFDANNAALYAAENITPILNSPEEIAAYNTCADDLPKPILHFDTGMNRLGLRAEHLDTAKTVTPAIIMSHFACADEPDHDMNDAQFEAFKRVAQSFPSAPKSLANSFGVFRSGQYHLDIVRPGMSLYGLNPKPEGDNPMRPVVKLSIPILQIKEVEEGETAGYNATYRFKKKSKLAIVPLGYADGFLRSLSNEGALYWKNIRCPIRGRVSMDLTIVDLSSVPENDLPAAGDMMEVIGSNQSADDIAQSAGTIGYETLTSLSRRYTRTYIS